MSILSACGGSSENQSPTPETSAAALQQAPAGSGFFAYIQKSRVDETGFMPMGSPESLGGRVLEGSPVLSGRIDVNEGGMMAGVFKATTGKVLIHFLYNEHATILDGEVTLTDESGETRTFKRGDSYFVRQGQTVVWNVKGRHVIKTIFTYTQPQP